MLRRLKCFLGFHICKEVEWKKYAVVEECICCGRRHTLLSLSKIADERKEVS